MKKLFLNLIFLISAFASVAQDVDYKKGMIKVDGEDYAKLDVKKQNFGLTKSFEVFSLSGTKIIIAVVATEFEQDKHDNSFLYYRLSFLTANQVGIFKIPALGQEKGFAKLIGNSGILVKDSVNLSKLTEFIASKSVTPQIAVDYTIVYRDKAWPISILKDKNIEQNQKIIGNFKPIRSAGGQDFYEIRLPTGVVVAGLNFTGGNNAQNFELWTAKDNYKRVVPIPQKDKILAADASIDPNLLSLKRIVKWLVDNQYL
jgi:hypothetical protein